MDHDILFKIDTFATGPDSGFAGYTDYKKVTAPNNLESEIAAFTQTGASPNPTGRPTRIGKPGGKFDSSLSLLSEEGENRYSFFFDTGSRTKFAGAPPIIEIPLLWEGNSIACLREIQLQTIAGKQVASFVFDKSAIPATLIEAVKKSGHDTAIKIPFYFNMIDSETEFQPWIVDDHRYHHPAGISHFESEEAESVEAPDHHHGHDHDEHHSEDGTKKVMNHGGIHPPGKHQLKTLQEILNHGGIHPPGVASFLIVELP